MPLEGPHEEDQERRFPGVNNFFLRLPDDRFGEIGGYPHIHSGLARAESQFTGNLDLPSVGVSELNNRIYHSPRFLLLTRRDHYAEIDRVILELGLWDTIVEFNNDSMTVMRKPSVFKNKTQQDDWKYVKRVHFGDTFIESRLDTNTFQKRMLTVTMPVFEALLKRGYTRYDLWR